MKETICRESGEHFTVSDEDLEFLEQISPVFDGRKCRIPPPTLSPRMRLRRRLAFVNQTYLFNRLCSATGKKILSMYPPETRSPIYENDVWWEQRLDPLSVGKEFDFSKDFFSQFGALLSRAPLPARSVLNVENSDFCNNSSDCRDCYLVFNTNRAENCMYGENVVRSRDCLDCSFTKDSELCFDCTSCNSCYNLQSSLECDNCSDSYFLRNCSSCRYCFGCANLSQASYRIFNIQYSPAEYERYVSALRLASHHTRETLTQQVLDYWNESPRPHISAVQCEDVAGNLIYRSKNVSDSFLISGGENLKYCFNLDGPTNRCIDYSSFGISASYIYEATRSGKDINNVSFSCYAFSGCAELLYCYFCVACQDCFGCAGLHRKRFCILNRQYTEDEYHRMTARIVEHMERTKEWGEFFPMSLSLVPYNYSQAQRLFPLSRTEASLLRAGWHDKPLVTHPNAVPAAELPDEVPDSDETVAATSALSGRVFLITKEELRRRRSFSVPLPRLTYDERMDERARHLGGVTLYSAACPRSGKRFLTAYPPDIGAEVWDRDTWTQEFRG